MMSPSKELQNVLVEKTSQWVDSDSAKIDEPRIVCPSEDGVNIATAANPENKTT